MFKRVLVPVDSSDFAFEVVDAALRVAGLAEATVTLIRVHLSPASLDPEQVATDLAVIDEETQRLVAKATARNLGLQAGAGAIDATVRSGPIVATILETAEELRSELIVVGTHGRKGLAEMFTGSTSEQIVAKATCAVLVLKPEGFPFLTD